MKKLFPTMLDRPEGRTLISGIPYWAFAFFLFPFMIALFSQDSGQVLYGAWLDMGYHLINFIVVIICFLPYLRESFLNVQLYLKKIFKTVALGVVVVVAIKILMCILFVSSSNELFANAAFGHLLTTESDLAYFSTALIEAQPLWGTLCVVLLTPVVTSCLLYACTFAPICNNRPWLAYIIMTGAFLLIQLIKIFSLWSGDEQLAGFWVQIPIHLLVCWTYQYTDTIWTPIAIHSISNLLLSLGTVLMVGII